LWQQTMDLGGCWLVEVDIRKFFDTQALKRKLQGHFAYYGGVMANLRCLHCFRYEVMRLWRKWLSRGKRRGQWSWARFNQLLKRLVLPWPRGWVTPCVVNP
jgi:hypothetical protein